MNAQALLENLQARGAALQINGAVVRVSPSSILTDDDRALIRELKPALLELLSSNAEAQAPALIEDAASLGTPWKPLSAGNPMEAAAPLVLVVPAVLTPRVLLAAARRIDKRLVLTTAERFELGVKLACLDCGISLESC
jgi:hypothetical protein